MRNVAALTLVIVGALVILGRVAAHAYLNNRDKERVAEFYTYKDDGSCTLTIFPAPIPRTGEVGIDSEVMLQFSLDAVRIVLEQDRDGKPRRRVLYDIDNREIREVILRYDSEGRLVEEGEVDYDGEICQDFRDEYRYDSDGRCIEKTVYRRQLSNRLKIMAYNANGDISEERFCRLPGGMDMSEFIPQEHRPPKNWTTVYTYNYDEHLNWVSRTATTETEIPNDKNSPPPLITTRNLQYY